MTGLCGQVTALLMCWQAGTLRFDVNASRMDGDLSSDTGLGASARPVNAMGLAGQAR